MHSGSLPPVAVAIGFVDRINRGDVDALGKLMTDDHELLVFDEPPVAGREANVDAWRGYLQSFPDYVIYPRRIAESDRNVAILGHTTGSHLGLPDAEESSLTMIWLAEVVGGAVRRWRLVEDEPENRRRFGLEGQP